MISQPASRPSRRNCDAPRFRAAPRCQLVKPSTGPAVASRQTPIIDMLQAGSVLPSWLSARQKCGSISLDARLSNDLCPFGALGPEQGSGLIRRIADCLEAKRRHFLHAVRQRDDLDDLAMEQRGNLPRCSGRNDERKPSLALYFRIAG